MKHCLLLCLLSTTSIGLTYTADNQQKNQLQSFEFDFRSLKKYNPVATNSSSWRSNKNSASPHSRVDNSPSKSDHFLSATSPLPSIPESHQVILPTSFNPYPTLLFASTFNLLKPVQSNEHLNKVINSWHTAVNKSQIVTGLAAIFKNLSSSMIFQNQLILTRTNQLLEELQQNKLFTIAKQLRYDLSLKNIPNLLFKSAASLESALIFEVLKIYVPSLAIPDSNDLTSLTFLNNTHEANINDKANFIKMNQHLVFQECYQWIGAWLLINTYFYDQILYHQREQKKATASQIKMKNKGTIQYLRKNK